jgi:hypothetical protein
MYYWRALGFKVPECSDRDIRLLKAAFDKIFFAWNRFGFENPRFPYSYLFKKIVTGNPKYSDGLKAMTRFTRVLRCETRRLRYAELYQKCAVFDYKCPESTTRMIVHRLSLVKKFTTPNDSVPTIVETATKINKRLMQLYNEAISMSQKQCTCPRTANYFS